MSGRIRSIKPELLDDAVTANLSDMAFRLFIATIVLADDYGRLRAEPGWLMGQIFWARTVQVETFLAALGELEPLIRFYTVNGQRYAEIRNWAKHQKVSHPGKPRVPAPPEALPRPSGESPETLVPDLRSPIPISDPEREPRAHACVAPFEPESDSRIRVAPTHGRVRFDDSLEDDARAVWESRTMNRSPGASLEDVWLGFCGQYSGQDFRSREGVLGRWQKWIGEQFKIADKDRDARRARVDARSGPPPPVRESPEQAKEFARQLAARVAARKGAA